MPEFRLRRKKQNRRTTVNNADETARQIQEAKKLVKPVLEPPREEKPVETQEEHVDFKEEAPTSNGHVVGGADGLDSDSRSSLEKRNSFVQEREKFFELLKTKYPEQANSLDVGVANVHVGVVKEEEEGVVDKGGRESESPISPDKIHMVCHAPTF